jgi:DNA repair exonuclease SbcCD ATPase subunit
MTFPEFLENNKTEILILITNIGTFAATWFTIGRRDANIKDIDLKKKEQTFKKDSVDFIDELVLKFEKLQSKIIILQSTINEVKEEKSKLNLKYEALFQENKRLKEEIELLKKRLYDE